MNFLAQKRSRILSQNNISQKSLPPDTASPENFYYREIAKLTGSGGWSVNFREKKSFLDSESKRILETPKDFNPSLRSALDFYAPDYKDRAAAIFMECSEGHSFSTTLKMQTYTKKEFWARAIGRPIFDEYGEVIGIQGIFQDISDDKQKEIELLKSLKIIESQNTKLNNFANIITHSLRSHSSNLQMTLHLLKDATDSADKKELTQGLHQISESIATTVGHLAELGSIQTKAQEPKEMVFFEKSLENVKNTIRRTLTDTRSEIFTDFSEIPSIPYIPSYLESILLNLITNAVKYRHPERSPVIEIYSYRENDCTFLMVKDNGLGIDLEKHGNRIFNIYQTFHNHKDAEGVGLFLVRNKIESLQGTISVQSEVGKGSTFTIRF
ncbi:MAG: PAS domain-containing sensor histidine kinase [Bacteroidia bacterium]|nr:PAS domain-containing sensor histidine kinase [Bacteroidia bacterium]NNF30969.1 PAS domain-containing sensor histidine kinase [Flavobacteriaceae bacterium]MBT8274931.1 PAS domain-containing sensor histidine kinase [Bacteroidia bacterium]NNJ82614.1 PAS domain-containing sensor histidine kinase [Flavobacteriaceae bacterium]NNK53144.1 PAS domain-containing sensor histidine kinase [Flavobacteriaceae bacterium]